MSVRDMYNQAFDKVNGGDAFGYSFMVFMALIVEGHRSPIIGINPGSGNDRSSKISADVFKGDIRRTQVRFGSNIKAFGMAFVALILKLEEHTQDDIPDRMKQAVKKGMVLKKKMRSSSGMVKTQCL